MSVTENGVSLPTGEIVMQPDLGTNIFAALASSLGAVVETNNAKPDLRVSIVHHEV